MMKRFGFRCLILAFLLTLALCACAQADVVFSEVMASTAAFVGERHDDWVELHNTGDKSVSLSGWYLSNDPYNLRRWAFPDTVKIAKGGYLVVYCAGGEVSNGQSGALYANFKISAKGDELYLTDPQGNTSSLSFGAQFGNVSYGLPDGGDTWLYLENATPGKANDKNGYAARAQEPVIETAAGFYDAALDVVITAPEGQEIRYTTDGSEPTRASKRYTAPIAVSQTTVIRARAFADDLLGSTTAGSTFFINDRSPVPVVSIYTDDTYLYNQKTGVMVKGSGSIPNYEKDWEYPIQVEYFDASGQRQISQMATFRVTSHSSRSLRQKSLALFARKAFGSDTFDYPFFENRPYTQYSSILLRSTNSDHRSCRMRDAVLSELSTGLNLYYQAAQPIVVYLNGEYFGHYNLREKANKDSLAQWEGITDPAAIRACDILQRTGTQRGDALHGSNADWIELMDFVKANSLNDADNLQYVLDRLDVDSLYNYVIFSMIIGNYDVDNVRMYRFPGGKWTFFLHDVEAGCMNNKESPVDIFLRSKSAKAGGFPHWVLAALLEVPEYKDYFLRRTAEIIESNFLYTTQVEPVFNKYIDTIGELLPRHIKKFPGLTMKEWKTNVGAAMYYARIRPKKVITWLSQRLKLTNAQQQEFFAHTLELLAQYNARQ